VPKKRTLIKKRTVSKRTVAAKPSTKTAEKPSAKAFEKSVEEAAKALARADHETAIAAATFVIDNASALKANDYGGRFTVDTARCLLAFAQREINEDAASKAAMAGLTAPAFNTEQDAKMVTDELARLGKKAKLAESQRGASARTILAYCLRHLIFWRETLAAGLHTNAKTVDRATIGASIATVRSALLTKLS